MSDEIIIDTSSGTNDERYCTWYTCPDCDCYSIALEYNYCPECGKEINWDTSTVDRIKKKQEKKQEKEQEKEQIHNPAIDEIRRQLIEGELI